MQTIRIKAPKNIRLPSRAKLLAFLASRGFGPKHTGHLTLHRLIQMGRRFGFFGRTADAPRTFDKPKASQRLS